MMRSGFAIYSIQHSNFEALIERQYCQNRLYLIPETSVEIPISNVEGLPFSMQHSNSEGFIERQYFQYPLYL
jgi:hypothetical protein